MNRSRRLDQYCADIGRHPSTLRGSLLVYPRFVDVWADEVAAESLVERFHEVGFTEFVFGWPSKQQMPVFELSWKRSCRGCGTCPPRPAP